MNTMFFFPTLCLFALVGFALGSLREEQELGMTLNKFALDLHRQISATETNAFMSPYSIAVALAMTYVGASGMTKREIGNVLGFSEYSNFERLISDLSSTLTMDPNYTLIESNGFFPNVNANIKENYRNAIVNRFHATSKALDYGRDAGGSADYVNDWISNSTDGLITDMIGASDLTADTILLLVNAIYFHANWSSPFPERNTRLQPFNLADGSTRQCNMMAATISAGMASSTELNARVLELNYSGGGAAMYVILPDNVDGLRHVEDNLSPVLLEDIKRRLKTQPVSVQMPKFTVTHFMDLIPSLHELGLRDMFSNNADFSTMTSEKVSVSDIRHQSFVNIDEHGTEAAGATVVFVSRSAAHAQNKFVIDRPFLFVICDRDTGTILFVGRIGNPTRTRMTRAALLASGALPATTSTASLATLFLAVLSVFIR